MKLFRYFLDGIELADDPIGWDEAKWVIFREKTLNALLVRIDLQLEFHGDGYAALATAFDTNGHCATVDIEIQELTATGVYRRIHSGLIRLSTLTRDRKQFTIKTPVEDNSFYAKIHNNKSIAAFPFAERSKNDTAITAGTLSYFNAVTLCSCGIYSRLIAPPYTYTGAGYRVFDLFTYLISFMTDGAMDFQSTLFDSGGDYDGLIVTCGEVFKTYLSGTTETAFKDNFPKISFEQLFKECNKKLHLGMMVDNSGARPKLVIEYDSYFKQTSTMHTCSDIDQVIETVDISKLYSKLILGSSKTLSVSVQCPPNGLDFPERVSLLGFKEEEFIILGNCNIDAELNLKSDFIISSNIIEDGIENGASNNDQDPFFIMCEPYYGNWLTKTGNIFNQTTPCQFNIDLNNINTTNRWLSGIPNQFAQYLATSSPEFLATKTTSMPVFIPTVQYNDDFTAPNFDTDNNYNTATYSFTAPDDGIYSFSTHTPVYRFIGGFTFSVTVTIELYNSSNVLLNTYPHNQIIPSVSGNYTLDYNDTFFMATGDYCLVTLSISNPSIYGIEFNFPAGDTFACTASATGGGTYTSIDTNDYDILNHVFDKDLTPDNFETILSDPRGLINCTTHKSYSFSAWIEELSFTRAKGQAKWKLFSTHNLNQ